MCTNSLVHMQQYNEPQNKSKYSQNRTRCKDVGSRADTSCEDEIVVVCESEPARGDLYCGAGSWRKDYSSFEVSFLVCFKNDTK